MDYTLGLRLNSPRQLVYQTIADLLSSLHKLCLADRTTAAFRGLTSNTPAADGAGAPPSRGNNAKRNIYGRKRCVSAVVWKGA